MRILLDMNLSPLWVAYFESQGIDSLHWSEVGDPASPDSEILEYARREGFILFSHDLDFSRLLALTGTAGSSVIQLRSQTVLPDQIGSLVATAIQQHSDALKQGALVVIDSSTSRARILPLT